MVWNYFRYKINIICLTLQLLGVHGDIHPRVFVLPIDGAENHRITATNQTQVNGTESAVRTCMDSVILGQDLRRCFVW